jgi:hypothetical protein
MMFARQQQSPITLLLVTLLSVLVVVEGLSPPSPPARDTTSMTTDRRALLFRFVSGGASVAAATAISVVQPALAVQEKEYRQGIEVNAFNGLIFNYKGGDFNGLPPDALNEPNVSYRDFNEKLKGGEVTNVEFLAPDGDVAYATFKDGTRLRIGEGYPIEQHDGYSSPMFCVRAVKNAGVPYKFIVPALMKMNG